MPRVTAKDVQELFRTFCTVVPAPEGQQWILGEGTNPTSFAIFSRVRGPVNAPGAGKWDDPLGGVSWTGTREAWEGMRAMIRLASYLNGNSIVRPERATA